MSESARLRLFVAVELPEEWLQHLEEAQQVLQRELETAEAPRLRWTRPGGIHLTLKFLGETPAALLAEVEAAIGQAVVSPPDITLRLGDIEMFTSGRRVRVIWAGLSGDTEELARLADQIDVACGPLGYGRGLRPFAPHLTLARVPEGATLDRAALTRLLSSVKLGGAPPFNVQLVSLMRSNLGPGGARYERLAAWPA